MSTSAPTPAQEEFAAFLSKNESNSNGPRDRHPEDCDDLDDYDSNDSDLDDDDLDEEDRHRNKQINAAMRMPTVGDAELQLPPASFDSGRATGVKGVIADARNYQMARESKWRKGARAVRRSVFGLEDAAAASSIRSRSRSSSGDNSDDEAKSTNNEEESFLQQWRESRRREMERDNRSAVRTRRTSPSQRVYGRLDQVDALGYLDSIEKVGRETVVVVFVYDHECMVSSVIEAALRPLVAKNPAVHFVKVHYEDIEFDNAGVPALLAYQNQGDLFANLTGLIEMIPENEDFDSDSLEKVLRQYRIL